MTAAQVSQVTGSTFFWARTIKVPYLDWGKSETLLDALKHVLDDHT